MENIIEEYIIEVPLAEVFINEVSKGFHNEYTCRNLQIAVKRGILKDVKIVFNNKECFIQNDGVILPNIPKGFYDISYKLSLDMMD